MTDPSYSDIQLITFRDRYAHGEERYPHEAWRRVARAVAKAERSDEDVALWEARYFELQDMDRYVPGGRIIAAMGTGLSVTAQNCYVIPSPVDSCDGILDSLRYWIEIQRKGGGVGVNLSSLRPAGTEVKGVNGTSSGPVSWANMFADATNVIIQGGSRRGAAMIMIDDSHPDVLEFIHAKEKPGRLEGCNMSVCISDEFMEAAHLNLDWDLRWDGRVYRTVKAKQVWDEICDAAWRSAEPGIYFMGRANADANSGYFETLISTNPSMPAGTLVCTRDGIFPIEELEGRQFMVKSLDGTWAPAECRLSGEDEEILEISFGKNKITHSTPQHRWPVAGRLGRLHKVDASELRPNDLIPLNRNEPLGIQGDMTLTEDDGFFCGYLFGDGTLHFRDKGAPVLSIVFAPEERPLAERLVSYMNERKADPSTIRPEREGSENLNISTSSVPFVAWVEEKFGWTGKGELPKAVWRSNDAFIRGFVDGWFSSDGHVARSDAKVPVVLLTSSREKPIIEMAKLLSFYGIGSNVNSSVVKKGVFPNGKDYGREYARWDLKIQQSNMKKFARVFGLSHRRKAENLAALAVREFRVSQELDFAEVKSVRSAGRARVWDISVLHTQHMFPSQYSYTGNCGEQPLGSWGACLLGSFNLAAFVGVAEDGQGAVFDWDSLRTLAGYAVRFNDNIVDLSEYPLPECRDSQQRIRRMGIGVMGLADALIRFGWRYGSKEAVDFTARVFETLRDCTYAASANLAEERGSFPEFVADRFLERPFVKALPKRVRDLIRSKGMRNCYLLTQAPTGTIAQMAGVNSGIEPYFAFKTYRRDRIEDGYWIKTEWADAYESADRPAWLVTANDVTPEEHVMMQAAAQRFVDSSISKTANLPESATVSDVARVYELAYEMGLKSLSVYRDNSRAVQVLNREDVHAVAAPATGRRKMPTSREAVTHSFRVGEQDGYLTVGRYDDGSPGEVFLRVSKQGSTISGLMDTIAMLMSYCLQSRDIGLATLVDKLSGVRFEPSGMTGNPDVPFATSVVDYMARWMALEFGPREGLVAVRPSSSGVICPVCGMDMIPGNGCFSCSCGFEKCG